MWRERERPQPCQNRCPVPLPLQDKWEQLVTQDSHLEIFGHVSLMTLDTVMKCAFSYQGSVQTDRSVTTFQWQVLVLTRWGGPPWELLRAAQMLPSPKSNILQGVRDHGQIPAQTKP